MNQDRTGVILRSDLYTGDRQKLFATLAGDFNPMHVDPVVARRTLVGNLAVHGIHQVLSGMEAVLSWLSAKGESIPTPAGFTAQFLKPVTVGDSVDLHLVERSDERCKIAGKMGDTIVCKITLLFGPSVSPQKSDLPPLPVESVTELSFAELNGKAGRLILGLDLPLAEQLFPLTTATLGAHSMAETLALSRLVGMHCPGLHSIFGQATVRYLETSESDLLTYRVEQTDARFGRIVMTACGSSLDAQLLVYFRPPPVAQADMAAVATRIKPGCFANSVALIVGGSRGLGEITAKIIAAGGGLPIITYHQGEADAARIVQEIHSHGGRCEMLRLDIRSDDFSHHLAAIQNTPRSLYYFATPKIFERRRGLFDHQLLRDFTYVYVTAFGHLLDHLAKPTLAQLRVFYPSSVAIDENVPDLVEYAMAKRQGEELCAFYNRHSKKIEIVVERLPRISTDQTATMLPFAAQNALDVMLPLVGRLENSFAA